MLLIFSYPRSAFGGWGGGGAGGRPHVTKMHGHQRSAVEGPEGQVPAQTSHGVTSLYGGELRAYHPEGS